MKNPRAIILSASLALLAVALAACNTVKGVGTDLQKGAEATSKAIDKATD